MARNFAVDARTLLHLGRESIRDHGTAVLELVKNAYDADADAVVIEVVMGSKGGPGSYIRVTDDGHGMSSEDLDSKWMRIGASSKRASSSSQGKGRRVTGEKGIGRLSCDRLGEQLELLSLRPPFPAVRVRFDWSHFEAPGRLLEQVPVQDLRVDSLAAPPAWSMVGTPWLRGTQLRITKPRHVWRLEDIELLRRELGTFASPFDKDSRLGIYLFTNIEGAPNGRIESELLDVADVDLSVEVDGEKVQFTARQWDAHAGEMVVADSGVMTWPQFLQVPVASPRDQRSVRPAGPLKVRLLLIPRRADVAKRGGLSLPSLRASLDVQAGVRIYRDGVRVKPYGEQESPHGDWLGLAERKARDPAGAARGRFRVSQGQVVGAVFIGRDTNPNLTDTAGREGLLENAAMDDLRSTATGAIRLLEATYHQAFVDRERSRKKKSKTSDAQDVLSAASQALDQLERSVSDLPDEAEVEDVTEVVGSGIEAIRHHMMSASKAVADLASEVATLRLLSTVGIAASVFGHEVRAIIAQLLASVRLSEALLERMPPRTDAAARELAKATRYGESLNAWGSFALARVRRDKRTRKQIDLKPVVDALLNEMEPLLAGKAVALQRDLVSVRGAVFPLDVEAIVVNLVTNAYYAAGLQRKNRVVRVTLREELRANRLCILLRVEDSGDGVALKYRQRIWEPLFTTKVDRHGRAAGTGLGLGIVQNIVDDAGGDRRVGRSSRLGGAEFSIWLPTGRKH